MILVDKPYVSDFFKNTVEKNSLSIISTKGAENLGCHHLANGLSEEAAISQIKRLENPLLYTTSENAIGWISQNLAFTDLPDKIELFKNKVKFRDLINPLYPDFYYREVPFDELNGLEVSSFPTPCIIKPSVGFFSMGVYPVNHSSEWEGVKQSIIDEVKGAEELYPKEVLNTTSFIIEECIEGEEFAIDAYFNDKGEPIILGILQHIFSSGEDVSDRVYITSKNIIEENLKDFTDLLAKLVKLTSVKNFPVHVELRRDQTGFIQFIEVNPMRFGGWCTTADLTYRAYGLNPYLAYFSQEKPHWPSLLQGKEEKLFSIIVLDNSTGVPSKDITSFDYDKLLSTFKTPLELRKIDHREYPVFGFIFAETDEADFEELERILKSDLKEYVIE
jgi:hypothetical protein